MTISVELKNIGGLELPLSVGRVMFDPIDPKKVFYEEKIGELLPDGCAQIFHVWKDSYLVIKEIMPPCAEAELTAPEYFDPSADSEPL